MSGEVEKCPILHVCPKFDVFTLHVCRMKRANGDDINSSKLKLSD